MDIGILNWLETLKPYAETLAAIGTIGLAIASFIGLIYSFLINHNNQKYLEKTLKIIMKMNNIKEDDIMSRKRHHLKHKLLYWWSHWRDPWKRENDRRI